ncbi:MAG: phosphate transport system protein [Frankiaceae bacterium]|jgi:phosphate transport system protein|nr:phosphate transport system protein [Frankiaceae bacterium]
MVETRRAFHEELSQLTTDTVRLAVMARRAIHSGTRALLELDLEAVSAVIDDDRQIDELTDSIEERAFDVLARQSPAAGDLRTLMTTIRGIHELERIGDHMVKIAKAARRLYPRAIEIEFASVIERMGLQAMEQLSLATEAFSERDVARAKTLADMDDVMDELQRELYRAIFAAGAKDDGQLQRAVQIALVGRFYERMADHSVNFGERVEFMVTGHFLEHAQQPHAVAVPDERPDDAPGA